MEPSIDNYISYLGNNKFRFLNIEVDFGEKVIWDYLEGGKLWTYNLNYFEFLNQGDSKIFVGDFNRLIKNYIAQLPYLKTGNDPFPTSLRIINWIKYFIKHELKDHEVLKSLYSQCYILKENKECHLLGNHLLENGFALTISGLFFQDKELFNDGKKILLDQLNEQILNDGAHFELSPMYHSLMLYRLFDVINMIQSNLPEINKTFLNQDIFLFFLKHKASLMCSWLENMIFSYDSFPLFNDSTNQIAPSPFSLLDYAKKLSISSNAVKLFESGYRRLKNEAFDIIIKAGNIGPDYIPGHAHADSLSFVCNISEVPLIVDPGITTYEKNENRHFERSTINHNTVSVGNQNSSMIWNGFRVAKRAKTTILSCSSDSIEAYHNGYKVLHKRSLTLKNKALQIIDNLTKQNAEAHFHFHPDLAVKVIDNKAFIQNKKVSFVNAKSVEIFNYRYSTGFNNSLTGKKITVKFYDYLITTIEI